MPQHGPFACPDRSKCGFRASWRSFQTPKFTLLKRLKNVFPHPARTRRAHHLKMLKKPRLRTYPTLALRDAPCPKHGSCERSENAAGGFFQHPSSTRSCFMRKLIQASPAGSQSRLIVRREFACYPPCHDSSWAHRRRRHRQEHRRRNVQAMRRDRHRCRRTGP